MKGTGLRPIFGLERMNKLSQKKIGSLVRRYNDVLLQSMRIAIAEDLINLMVLNRDDEEQVLREVLLHDKKALYDSIIREFLKYNGSHVQQGEGIKMDSLPDLVTYFKERKEASMNSFSANEKDKDSNS